jgi:glycosyltransferase involved in cell wall biosynthesis
VVVYFLENRKKAGLGTAYVHGFKWALENKYDFIFEMDADFHNPNDLENYTMPVILGMLIYWFAICYRS